MSKFFVRHGMIVDEVHEIISFKKSKWLKKYISLNTRKQNRGTNFLERIFINYSILFFVVRQLKLWKLSEIRIL